MAFRCRNRRPRTGYRNCSAVWGDVIVNAPLGPKAALRIVGQAKSTGGYVHNSFNGTEPGDLDAYTFRGTLRLQPTDNLEILLRGDYSDIKTRGGAVVLPIYIYPNSPAVNLLAAALGTTQAGAIAYYNGLVPPNRYPNDVSYNSRDYSSAHLYGASVTVDYDLDAVKLKSITAYRYAKDLRFLDVDAMSVIDLYHNGPNTTSEKQFSQELQIVGDAFNNSLHYTTGLYYFHNKAHEINFSYTLAPINPNIPTYFDGVVPTRSKAIYGQATYDVTRTVHLTVGLRGTDESRGLISANRIGPARTCNVPPPAGVNGAPCRAEYEVKGTNLSYTAGLDWNVTSDVMVYGKTSRSFKSGGVNERLSKDPTTAQPFQPERLTDYEVGLKSDWFDHRLRVNVDYYHSAYDNIQRTVSVLNPNNSVVTVIQNAAKATVDGVEAEASALLLDNLQIQASAAFTRPKYGKYINPANGADLSQLPFNQVSKWTYGVSAGYNIPASFGTAHLQLDWRWVGRRNLFPSGGNPNIDWQPGYGLLNGQLRIELDKSGIDANIFAKNIFNKFYLQQLFDLGRNFGLLSGYPGTPRTFGMSLTKHF